MVKSLTDYLKESLNDEQNTVVKENEETIKDEKSFREAARTKFEEVFGDDLDEDKMNETIDGLLEDNKELVEKGEWGELIGILNKSFAPKNNK
jgi:hydrogenase maturation factor HypE